MFVCYYNYFTSIHCELVNCLQHFFGLVRGCGGASNHPTSVQFAQLVKLLSLYSLVKPPKGSNVSGSEMLDSLLKSTDTLATTIDQRKAALEKQLDKILDDGEYTCLIPDLLHDHDFLKAPAELNRFVISYVSGYVARKAMLWCNNCDRCIASLTSDEPGANTRFIELKLRGYLLYPSDKLEKLVTLLETSVQTAVANYEMCGDYVFYLVDEVMKTKLGDLRLGCEDLEHQKTLTKRVMKFFLITRMHFLCRTLSQSVKSDKPQMYNKYAKL